MDHHLQPGILENELTLASDYSESRGQ
jgi:hypothetical protein